jgi:hypothetical protein
MIKLTIKNGTTLTYDEGKDVISVKGVLNKSWRSVFILVDGSPNLFGFMNMSYSTIYDIYGGIVQNVTRSPEVGL